MYDTADGIYRIYQNNELIAERKNSLTETGKEILVRYLLRGRQVPFVNSICCGVSSASNTQSTSSSLIVNNSLGFQVAITPVEGSSFTFTDNVAETLVFSGTLSGDQQFTLYELGITSQITELGKADEEMLFDFDLVDEFDKYGTAATSALVDSTNARMGTQMFEIPFCTDQSVDYVESLTQLSDTVNTIGIVETYSSNDIFNVALFKPISPAASVTFKFLVDESNYYKLTVPITTASGYKISSATKGSAEIVGSPTWSTVNTLRISHNSASSIFLDGMRIEKTPNVIDIDNGLISRAVLSQPVVKLVGTPLDIEYSLVLGFNQVV
jgi:hypothetical protein